MRCTAVTIVLLLLASSAAAQPAQNIIIVTLDGLRWQEVFRGYDETFADKESGGVRNSKRLHEQFARPNTQQSRAALMPFLWNTLAPSGQLFGNHDDGSTARVTNPHHFSYPGYSELLCGFVEPRIDSNDPVPNPNVTVLEWLNRRPGFENRVAVFGAWTRFREILNMQRSRLHVVAGWNPIAPFNNIPLSPREETLNALLSTQTRMWPDEPPDAIVAQAALEHLRKHKPRVLYIGFGETDEWAHARRYDLYLESARRADEFLSHLWDHDPIDARLCRQDRHVDHLRPRPRTDGARLDRPQRQGPRRRRMVARRPRPWCPRRSQTHPRRHPIPGRRHHRLVARRRLARRRKTRGDRHHLLVSIEGRRALSEHAISRPMCRPSAERKIPAAGVAHIPGSVPVVIGSIFISCWQSKTREVIYMKFRSGRDLGGMLSPAH